MENNKINQKLLSALADRFDKLHNCLSEEFDPHVNDFYAYIASIIYDLDETECREFQQDGTINLSGKDLRYRAKQFLLPVVLDFEGLYIDEDPLEEDAQEASIPDTVNHPYIGD